ncbi:tRNA-uridine aminocarboxypropyltransferase [Thalassotalea aquiviva]|uniref:tRNA-uridine aminocarboxypropyltransferase n=1 Tax=Thalassotalea aquiviva TaxID=3242415 RepID=UPI00352A5A5D
MSRQYCTRCERPLVTCICQFACQVKNQVEVWFLQHPSEVNKVKGTAKLASLCLDKCKIIVGENFSHNPELNAKIDDPNTNVVLLYPDDEALKVSPMDVPTQQQTLLLILDGTWKKAYKMFQLSSNLHNLAKLTLASDITSEYIIRKHHKATDVSSFEATVHALTALENSQQKYAPMHDSFALFNQFQLTLSKQHSP